jgi:hypothetical protein
LLCATIAIDTSVTRRAGKEQSTNLLAAAQHKPSPPCGLEYGRLPHVGEEKKSARLQSGNDGIRDAPHITGTIQRRKDSHCDNEVELSGEWLVPHVPAAQCNAGVRTHSRARTLQRDLRKIESKKLVAHWRNARSESAFSAPELDSRSKPRDSRRLEQRERDRKAFLLALARGFPRIRGDRKDRIERRWRAPLIRKHLPHCDGQIVCAFQSWHSFEGLADHTL